MNMESNDFHGLPPLKRYKLMREQEAANNPLHTNSLTTQNSSTTICLPAKKRKDYSPDSTISSTSYCLPAKKRIWALKPFDLNLEYDHETPPIESPKLDIPENLCEKSKDPIGKSEENVPNDDDGIVCAVCNSTDGDPTDPIVLCDGCDIMVHTTCYGYPFTKGIPKGDWYCDECLDSKSVVNLKAEHTCCLCPSRGGALKATTDGKWAHLVCAIYVPEVFFSDPEGRQGIECSRVLKRRWEKKCCVCESESDGCVIDCSEPKCPLAFHVTCGLKEELCIEYRQGKKNKGDVVVAFCSAHTELWKKQEQTGKFKIVARDEQ